MLLSITVSPPASEVTSAKYWRVWAVKQSGPFAFFYKSVCACVWVRERERERETEREIYGRSILQSLYT